MSFAEPTDGGRVVKEGVGAVKVTLIGTVQPGDPLYGASTGWARADASDDTKRCQLIAGNTGGVSGDEITAYVEAIIDFGSTCTATIPAHLYLSDTAGDYSASAGTVEKVIGRMMTAQVAHVWGVHS